MQNEDNLLTSRMKKAAVRRHLIQIRINDADMEHVTSICATHNIKPSTLIYEFFQYSLQAFMQEQESENEVQMQLPLDGAGDDE